MSKLIPLLIFLLAGCGFGPGNLQMQAFDRFGIAPQSGASLSCRLWRRPGRRVKSCPHAWRGPRVRSGILTILLARLIYQVMSGPPNWQIVSESEAREVSQTITASNEAARLRELGEAAYADAVLIGRVRRFRERVGDEWGVKSPASVAFALELVGCAARRRDLVGQLR